MSPSHRPTSLLLLSLALGCQAEPSSRGARPAAKHEGSDSGAQAAAQPKPDAAAAQPKAPIPPGPTGVAKIDRMLYAKEGCVFHSESGDLDGEEPKDWAARLEDCEGAVGVLGNFVYTVNAAGEVTEHAVPHMTPTGGTAGFERLASDERVVLVTDEGFETVHYVILHLRDGELDVGKSVGGPEDRVELVRDSKRRIVDLVLHPARDPE
ncbi:MAG: hypothetical protein R6X02_21700 [Enhygromyxa sp.]